MREERHRTRWMTVDDVRLIALASNNATIRLIAAMMHRTPSAIRSRLFEVKAILRTHRNNPGVQGTPWLQQVSSAAKEYGLKL